jgi:two-component system sensor histidine kinase/response regulator
MRSPSTPHTVLLVDDSKDGLLVRRALLEEQGFDVTVALNGEEGLKLCEGRAFDVVVTSHRMPVMGGLELICRLRALKPLIPIVLLSGIAEPLGLSQENTGADAVIAKNSNEPGALVRWVKRLISRGPTRKPTGSQRRPFARAQA